MLSNHVNQLDDVLKRRCRVLRDRALKIDNLSKRSSHTSSEQYVLYIMRHALRWQENPALTAAAALANQHGVGLQVLLLVPYDGQTTTRSICFQQQAVLNLTATIPEHPETAAPCYQFLGGLCPTTSFSTIAKHVAAKAVMLVVELENDQANTVWQKLSPLPMLGVQANTLFPLAYDEGATTYQEFMDDVRYRRRLQQDLEITDPIFPIKTIAAPSAVNSPKYLNNLVLDSSTATLELNHFVPATPTIKGGPTAAQQYWNTLREKLFLQFPNLKAFNTEGLGTLLPYLDYGMLPPLQLMREAHVVGTNGALTFLEKFLYYREYYLQRPLTEAENSGEALGKIPSVLLSKLQSGTTGNTTIDTIVRQLIRTGVLPPVKAAELLTTLYTDSSYGNYRRDINAWYTLWGLTTSAIHEWPLENSSTIGKQRIVSSSAMPSIAVIGAGITGLMAARLLQQQQCRLTVYEQAQVPGGQLQHSQVGTEFVNVGLPFFTANAAPVKELVTQWRDQRWLFPWKPTVSGDSMEIGFNFKKPVNAPTRKLLPGLSQELPIHYGAEITDIKEVTGGFRLYGHHRLPGSAAKTTENFGFFDMIIVALPLAATKRLVTLGLSTIAAPLWSILLKVPEPIKSYTDIIVCTNTLLSYAIRHPQEHGSSTDAGELWTLYSNADWAREHGMVNQYSKQKVASAMVRKLFSELKTKPQKPDLLRCYAWPQEYPAIPPENPFLEINGAIIAGDWLLGQRVEDAILSGAAAAARVIEKL